MELDWFEASLGQNRCGRNQWATLFLSEKHDKTDWMKAVCIIKYVQGAFHQTV